MYCFECKVTVSTKTPLCPLCGASLLTDESNAREFDTLSRTYPRRPGRRRNAVDSFNPIFLAAGGAAALAAIITNAVAARGSAWSLVVVAALVYAYCVVRGVLGGTGYLPQKVLTHALVASLLVASFVTLTEGIGWAFGWVLPALILSSMLAVVFYIIPRKKSLRLFIFIIPWLTVFALPPFLVVVLTSCAPLYLSLATLVFGAAATAVLFLSDIKSVLKELKRKLDV